MKIKRHIQLTLFVLVIIATACTPPQEEEKIQVVLIADGRQRAYMHDQHISVGQFLEQVDVTLGEIDRITPPQNSPIRDGITITVVRVEERIECESLTIPHQQRTVPNEGLSPSEERLMQPGVDGVEEVCSRITIENGVETQMVEIQRVTIEAPQDEIVFVGVSSDELDSIPIIGTLAYISNGDIWIMRGSSASKRPITNIGSADKQVFSLSPDGNQLLFTQQYTGDDEDIYFNSLWVIQNTRDTAPEIHRLDLLNNILYAEWVPNTPNTFSYSTAEAREAPPGWQAFNDLWIMQLDPEEPVAVDVDSIVESSAGGIYGWWGTDYKWSADGTALAWARADSIGLVNLDSGEFQTLLNFPVFTTFQDWVWQPTLSWSPDDLLLVSTTHGPPFGAEQAESSPIFNVTAVTALADAETPFSADIIERAGIWAAPQFSPFVAQNSEFPQGQLAYLQARNPLNSVNDQYDLVIADRDGSNSQIIFPNADQPGIAAREIGQMTWSPDGRHLAIIYQGDLWIIEVSSGRSQRVTLDGGAALPQWVQ